MAEEDPDEDVALVLGASEDGEALGVLRKRGERVEAAVVRKAEEGKPLHGELVRFSPRPEPNLFDVQSLYEPQATRSGPAQVATERYRKGWDRLFSKKKRAAN